MPTDFLTIQSAIFAAQDGDVVHVMQGTYFENLDFLGKAITVESAEGPSATIIDGQNLGSVIRFISSEGSNSVLQGFTITHGSGTNVACGMCPPLLAGGGIFCFDSSPTIVDNIIVQNGLSGSVFHGGGIYSFGGAPRISGNEVASNELTDGSFGDLQAGGGIYAFGVGVLIDNNDIHDNESQQAGGIYVEGQWTVLGNIIANNFAVYSGGGGLRAIGSGLCQDNLILANASTTGGGVYANAAATDVQTYLSNVIRGNFAVAPGGVAAGMLATELAGSLGNFILTNTVIDANLATAAPGGVEIAQGMLVNCTITNNVSNFGTSGVSGDVVDLVNCTIAGNYCLSTCGNNAAVALAAPSTIANTIVYGNQMGPTLDPSDVQVTPGLSVQYSSIQFGYSGAGNVESDPLFRADDDFRLSVGSPAADAGSNLLLPIDAWDLDEDGDTAEFLPIDLHENARRVDAPEVVDTGAGDAPLVDMGAFELAPDCDDDTIADARELALGLATDCDFDGTLDDCQITADPILDCDASGTLDSCDISSGLVPDCNENGIPDGCELESNPSVDCNRNGSIDSCEIDIGAAIDCDSSGVPDECELASGVLADCNDNQSPDVCDIAAALSLDHDRDGIPDECEPQFVRGNCNGSAPVDISDAVFTLNFLFGTGPASRCPAACDSNDSGALDISDAIYTLAALFGIGPTPPSPYPGCGVDPTPSGAECAGTGSCF
ncbi:MAG: nitrous oxide reductase family maturation protein NosD [Planctomycetota bacterium]